MLVLHNYDETKMNKLLAEANKVAALEDLWSDYNGGFYSEEEFKIHMDEILEYERDEE